MENDTQSFDTVEVEVQEKVEEPQLLTGFEEFEMELPVMDFGLTTF